ncbi:hypothetical protein PYCCODRAFT_1343288, partial [Trametes coccinea BRFM310]
YIKDTTFRKILENPSQHKAFTICGNLVHCLSCNNDNVPYVPGMSYKGRSIPKLVIDWVHTTLGHVGPQHMSEY